MLFFLMDRSDVISRLKTVEPALREIGVAGLYLYGSFARDEAGPNSDVDVFVDAQNDQFMKLSPFTLAYELIHQALPNCEIGYGTREGLSPHIRQKVEHEAIRIF
jgi:hypothetical protein